MFCCVDLCVSIAHCIATFMRTILSFSFLFRVQEPEGVDRLSYILSYVNLFLAVSLVYFHVRQVHASLQLIKVGKNVKDLIMLYK